MKRNIGFCFAFVLSTFITTVANGQYVVSGLSLDTPNDSRSMALGESFVAIPRNHTGMMYNPATIANIQGLVFSYARRNDNIFNIEGRNHWTFSAAVQAPYIDVGFFYSRYNLGEVLVTSELFPDGTGQKINPYDVTFGIAIAREFDEHWNLGVTVKSFDMSGFYNLTPSSFTTTVSKPILFDLGILFTHQFPISEASQRHAMNIGASFQNIGGDPTFTRTPPQLRLNSETQLPRYFRIGFSYELDMNPSSEEKLRPFRFVGSGEYRTITNSNFNPAKDFWGFGMEATMFELVVFRLGGYGASATTVVRYGFGLCAPLQKFGASAPVVIRADYAAVPQNIVVFDFYDRKVLHSFSISILYENELF